MTALVLGVGNAARGDDGAGAAVAALAAADPRLAGAVVRSEVQLTPELAADVVEASVVVIADACVGPPPGRVACQPVTPGEAPLLGHHLTPGALVRLAATAFGRVPPVYLLSIGATEFEGSAPLSPAVIAALPEAVDVVAGLVQGWTEAQATTSR